MANVLFNSKRMTIDVRLLHRVYELASQKQDKWCWAAVSAAIARFYDHKTSWTQCTIASAELNLKCCAADKKACNQYWDLHKALQRIKHFNMMTMQSVKFDDIVRQLRDNRPVAVRLNVVVGKGKSFGHFAVIAGWNVDQFDTQWITLYDPWNGKQLLKFNNLKKDHPTTGSSWTTTYFTQP